jgi:hypothetical protein
MLATSRTGLAVAPRAHVKRTYVKLAAPVGTSVVVMFELV